LSRQTKTTALNFGVGGLVATAYEQVIGNDAQGYVGVLLPHLRGEVSEIFFSCDHLAMV